MNGLLAMSTNAVAYPDSLCEISCLPSAVVVPDKETYVLPSLVNVLCGRAIIISPASSSTNARSLADKDVILEGSKYF